MRHESPPDCYRQFFDALRGLRGAGSQRWMACCPAHDDDTPSLSLKIDFAGRLLVKCHAGCPTASVLQSLGHGFGLNHLFSDYYLPPPGGTAMAEREEVNGTVAAPLEFVRSFDYRKADGKLSFQVCRYRPKTFRQRRPNPTYDPRQPRGGDNLEFLYNLDGVTLTPYRLPDVLAALKKDPKRWVLHLEGEGKVDAAWDDGFVATCNPGGALKWKPEYSEMLLAQRVVVLPDNDPIDGARGFSVGRRHAEEVADAYRKMGSVVVTVDLPDLPPKGDYVQWRDAHERAGAEGRRKLMAGYIRAALTPTPALAVQAAVDAPDLSDLPGPDAMPEPVAPEPARDPSLPPRGPDAVQDTLDRLSLLRRSVRPFQSPAEWYGTLMLDLANFQVLAGMDLKSPAARGMATQIAAQIIRGLDEVL